MSKPLPRVIATDIMPPVAAELLAGKVELFSWRLTEDGAADVEGVFTYGHPSFDGPMMDRLSGLKVISNHGVGVDHIDVQAAAERNIPVGNTPGVLNKAVADMGFALLLSAARRLIEGDRFARSEQFTRFDPNFLHGWDAHGSTLGIIGLGGIGWEVARRAKAFDMTILYCNRNRREDAERELGVKHVSQEALLAESDFVMLVVPLNDATRGMIGRDELARMKPTATLINIARGPIVDTEALAAALKNCTIRAAALDVTDPEPLPRDHPLLKLDNVVLAPHLGSATRQTRRRMAEVAVENLLRGLRGEPLLHQVRG